MTRRVTMTLLALLLGAGLAAAELNIPPGRWWENPRVVERIHLSESQQAAIRDLVVEHARRMIDLNADVKRAEFDLAELVDRDVVDPDQVRQAFAALQKARQRLENERFELLLAVRQSLTREQWRELGRMRQEFNQRQGDVPRPGVPRAGGPPLRRPGR
jgi:Spy/CpxP family protein refolding chaperone